nr:DUF1566 domain-containing protein [uncultured Draconibacterium sp.]
MKKIKSFIFIFLLGVGSLLAQTPGAFNYQAVLRDTEGKIISNQDVSIQISILQQSASGEIVFQEKHSINTNEFGLIVLEIGNGLPLTGTLAEINWGESTHFLKVELDATGGESYVEMGTSQMLSVPYALYAKSSGSNFSGKYSDLEGTPDLPNDISDLSDAGKLLFDGDYNSLINKPDLSQLNSENTDAWDKDVTDDFDGDYNSLTNKPTTISADQATAIDANSAKVSNVKADWDATTGEAQILNKPDLTVYVEETNTSNWDKNASDDFDGNYNNLTNKPTTISAAQATAIDANTAKVSNVKADWIATSGEAQILNKPDLTVFVEETNTANWDKNASDDFDGDYNNLTNKPTTISATQATAIDANTAKVSNVKADWIATSGEAQILNKPDLTVFVEETNTANWDKNASDDFDGDYNNLTNKPTTISATQATAIDANTAKVSNVKADWIATIGEAQILNKPDLTVFVEETNTANWDKNASDDFDGNYNNLINKPTTISAAQATAIDANTAKLSNVKADWNAASGEAQILNKPDLTVYVEEANTSGWDKNAADDFDGNYNNLTNKPTTISAAQATAIDANTAKVSNVKADWNATTGEAQILNKPDLTAFVETTNTTGWDKDASDDFDGNYNNLTNKPTTISATQATAINANTAKVSNVKADWNATTGEAQIMNKPDLTVFVEKTNTSGWDKNASDDFSGSFNDLSDVPANLDTDDTDDFSGNFNDLSNVPANLDIDDSDDFDGDYNNLTNKPTTISATQATAIDANTAKISNVKADWNATTGEAQILNKPDLTVFVEEANTSGWDKNASDDFSGSFNDLSDVPANLDVDDSDDFDGDYNSLTNKPSQDIIHDADADTKIQVEKNSDEDIIRFDIAGNEKMILDNKSLSFPDNNQSVFIGTNSGSQISGNEYGYNTFVGFQAGRKTNGSYWDGSGNSFFGHMVGDNNTSGSNNAAFGKSALYKNTIGSNNVAIGEEALYENQTGSGNIAIGYRAGRNISGSNKLFIDNSNTDSPLIYGEFDNNLLRINGTLNINNAYNLPAADGTAGQYLTTDGSGTTQWTSGKTYTLGLNTDLGGYVIYVTPNGKHGLVAATQDQSTSATWYDAQDAISDPSNHDSAGQNFTDWRLPTKYELNIIHTYRTELNASLGQFTRYWSSTEYDPDNSYNQLFNADTIDQGAGSKTATNYVRAIRSF